ncbi:NUDIX hydrolase [Arthrobacter silvisoli]|uniref:NUDIX hydrolase n=1 Tax=Arthrobacter silvisoli TaxID=2291022 RepID=UPI000E21229C|nr:CoA pyrophosphatase [Arthrobacter silvisoli]
MTALGDLLYLVSRIESGDHPTPDPRIAVGEVDADLARKAAILMLFGVLDDVPAKSTQDVVPADLDVLLLERAHTLGDHPGQVAFPGGGIDSGDESAVAAALREAVEETGLDVGGVQVLGAMPDVGLSRSNFVVTPVLAWWASPSPVRVVDYAESAQVFRVPVRDLLDPANRYMGTLSRGGRTFTSPVFLVNGVVVWGFTAMVLNGLFEALGWTIPWDEERLHRIQL